MKVDLSKMKIGDIFDEIPHDFREFGTVRVKREYSLRGYTIVPLGIIERAGYLVFKKVDQGVKLMCYAVTLDKASFAIEQDALKNWA